MTPEQKFLNDVFYSGRSINILEKEKLGCEPVEVHKEDQDFVQPARGMGPCEHGVHDFEDCPDCRAKAKKLPNRFGTKT